MRYPPDYRLADTLIEKCYRVLHRRRRLSIKATSGTSLTTECAIDIIEHREMKFIPESNLS